MYRCAGIPARYVEGYVAADDTIKSGVPIQTTQTRKTSDNVQTEENVVEYQVDLKDNAAHAWAEVYFDGIGGLPVDVTPGYYYDAVKLQQMVATPDMVHKTLAEDHNLMDAEQITDTGNDMDTAVAEVAELLRSLFLWKKTVLKENL